MTLQALRTRTGSALRSFFAAGFECSAHVRPDGVRLDLLAATGHARLAQQDYAQVRSFGMHTVRDGVHWHLAERPGRRYRWDSFLPMVRAAEHAGVQVIWDLCHYGWPDHLDIWSAAWVDRFAAFAAAVTRLLREESDAVPCFCPVNEISYWAWAGGEVGRMNPVAHGRGAELKRQLVRAHVAAVEAIRAVDSRARFIVSEPLIHVMGTDGESDAAERYRISQFEAHDMLTGRLAPELGGRAEYLDVIGVNYYPENQWYLHGGTIPFGHHAYRPLSELLKEVWERYGRPLLISETGPKEMPAPTGCITSVGRRLRRCRRACRSRASACIPYSIIRAGTMDVSAPSACSQARQAVSGGLAGRCCRS